MRDPNPKLHVYGEINKKKRNGSYQNKEYKINFEGNRNNLTKYKR